MVITLLYGFLETKQTYISEKKNFYFFLEFLFKKYYKLFLKFQNLRCI